jgi:predicted RNase H-like HicB family nuclease
MGWMEAHTCAGSAHARADFSEVIAMSPQNPKSLLVQIPIILEPDEDGYHAFCPALKGLHVDGETESETLENAKEAIMVYLDSLCLHGDPLPICPHLAATEQPDFGVPTEGVARNLTVTWPSLQRFGIS